jgi:hypothetical protein
MQFGVIEDYWSYFHKSIYITFKLLNTLSMYNKKKAINVSILKKCNVCDYMCVYMLHSTPKWFQHLLSLEVSQGFCWLIDVKALHGLKYYYSIFFKDHMHKAFSFGNHNMEKKLNISLFR